MSARRREQVTQEERAQSMVAFFRNYRWLKDQLLDREELGACLAGAEYLLAGGWDIITPMVGCLARLQYPERLQGSLYADIQDDTTAGVLFNNHPDTTLDELLALIEQAGCPFARQHPATDARQAELVPA
jgi:hypothetical protein